MLNNGHRNPIEIDSHLYLRLRKKTSYGASNMSLRAILLALLSKEPNTGYGLSRLLHRDLHHLWDARLQQIYVELAKLHAGGFLEVAITQLPSRPPKKVYTLTLDGGRALDDWLSEAPLPPQPKDELLMRLYCLERIPVDLMARWLEHYRDERRRECEGLVVQRTQLSHTDPASLGPLLALEVALHRAECDIVWCERTVSTITGGAADAPREGDPGEPQRAAREA